MAKEIKVPDLGVNVETVVILKWMKEVGDEVKMGDVLCEVETDKAATDLESVAKGVLLKKLFDEGAEVEKDTVIAYVGEAGEAVPE
ncbi:MAG: hypothetical protein JW936_09240 [Sedimentisphaerales bacterium]|nr:hypothetical protein [Sedimentisphaerales bacterium]